MAEAEQDGARASNKIKLSGQEYEKLKGILMAIEDNEDKYERSLTFKLTKSSL